MLLTPRRQRLGRRLERCQPSGAHCQYRQRDNRRRRSTAACQRRVAIVRSGLQEREHGQYAPVVVLSGGKSQLGEDARHVLLDRALGDHEPARDRVI
jgi:hypothetical protein